MDEDKYINEIENSIGVDFGDDERVKIKNVLYGYQKDIRNAVIVKATESVKEILSAAFLEAY